MIVATAGHIDHGKTTLVKALTGVDTDRLPEEKARGISIDLGFAYWQTTAGDTIGFVDVPGHERFIRNMLAGVCGIDYVMLVVTGSRLRPFRNDPIHEAYEPLRRFTMTGETSLDPPNASLPSWWEQDYIVYRRRDYQRRTE